MTSENVEHSDETPTGAAQGTDKYDPFMRGRYPVGVRTFQALDTGRGRRFPCDIWYPAAPQHAGEDIASGTQDTSKDNLRGQMAVRNATVQLGTYPLIVFSHSSGGNRQQSTFLCTHLSSHGYLVAALDHSDVIAAELMRKEGETGEQKTARVEAWVANRVPDIQFLLDHLLNDETWETDAKIDPDRIGIVGYSFGGWTALAATEIEKRIRAVVALAPAGSSQPKPGIIPAKLTFNWGRDVPTMYLVAEHDIMTPLAGMYELFIKTPATKQMVILRRADHMHFMDDVEEMHETVRKMPWTGESAWISKEMRPIEDFCPGDQAHIFVRGLTLCHMDATLKRQKDAQRLLVDNMEAELAERGVDSITHKP
jgi:dienelactone hydrolase